MDAPVSGGDIGARQMGDGVHGDAEGRRQLRDRTETDHRRGVADGDQRAGAALPDRLAGLPQRAQVQRVGAEKL